MVGPRQRAIDKIGGNRMSLKAQASREKDGWSESEASIIAPEIVDTWEGVRLSKIDWETTGSVGSLWMTTRHFRDRCWRVLILDVGLPHQRRDEMVTDIVLWLGVLPSHEDIARDRTALYNRW